MTTHDTHRDPPKLIEPTPSLAPAPDPSVPAPTIGRIVHYVMPSGPCAGEVRPAIVVRALPEHRCNLQVFLDGGNDSSLYDHRGADALAWKGTVSHGTERGQWHWPARV